MEPMSGIFYRVERKNPLIDSAKKTKDHSSRMDLNHRIRLNLEKFSRFPIFWNSGHRRFVFQMIAESDVIKRSWKKIGTFKENVPGHF